MVVNHQNSKNRGLRTTHTVNQHLTNSKNNEVQSCSALTPEQGNLATHVHDQYPRNRNIHTKFKVKELNDEITLEQSPRSISLPRRMPKITHNITSVHFIVGIHPTFLIYQRATPLLRKISSVACQYHESILELPFRFDTALVPRP